MQSGTMTVRQRRTTKIAVIEPWCTGCGGSPVCAIYCKYNALKPVKDTKTYPFSIMTVDPARCIGCGACIASGRDGIMLSGCPWNAIRVKKRME